jgi:hypothetical protein
VLVRDGRMLIATFHPELSDDTTVHEYFLKLVEDESFPVDPKSGRVDANSGRTSSHSSASPSASLRSTAADPSPMRRG